MKEETSENEPLHYQNGQSDAEKLMRRHLQNPDDVITDDELKNLKIAGTPDTVNPEEEAQIERKKDEDEEIRPATPWDVIDG